MEYSKTHKNNCLVCQADLVYAESHKEMVCSFCKKLKETNTFCTEGHFICDACHSGPALDLIENTCKLSRLSDPIALANTIMHHPSVKMHGPEHHFLVPAVLLTVIQNIENNDENKFHKRLEVAKQRARNLLGGFCGFYGACGAAVGTGVFVSVLKEI